MSRPTVTQFQETSEAYKELIRKTTLYLSGEPFCASDMAQAIDCTGSYAHILLKEMPDVVHFRTPQGNKYSKTVRVWLLRPWRKLTNEQIGVAHNWRPL